MSDEHLVLEILPDTRDWNDDKSTEFRMHFYSSSVRHGKTGEPLLTICNRGGGMRATREQVQELHEWLGEWLKQNG